MIVHRSTRVLITVEMTEEQSANLRLALGKVHEVSTTGNSQESFSKEEAEVIDDLRQSLLNV